MPDSLWPGAHLQSTARMNEYLGAGALRSRLLRCWRHALGCGWPRFTQPAAVRAQSDPGNRFP
eukprot:6942380-Alexandrium_andersonii.AAC.1